MFKSKYIFETRTTKSKRYLKNLSFLSLMGLIAYTIACLVFLLVSKNENKLAQEVFYKRPPDVVVVYTGDSGRISYAIELAKKYNQSNVFISGVYSKNTVNTLLRPLDLEGKVNPDLLNIDYQARNTVENVIATLQFLREKEGLEKVLIVSNDYHIMRIKLIMNTIKRDNDKYKFYYLGKKTNYAKVRSIKILYKEVFKYIRTYFFLMLWDEEQSSI